MRTLRKVALVSFCLILSIKLFAYTHSYAKITASSTINTNTTWNADTVLVNSNVVVNSGVTLTIVEGTYVRITGYYGFTVNGTVLANGVAGDSIVFAVIAHDTAGFYNINQTKGGWAGFSAIYNQSKFTNCIFKYIKNKSAGGLFTYSKGVTINGCDFYMNYTGKGLIVPRADSCIVINSIFYKNTDYNTSRYEGSLINEGYGGGGGYGYLVMKNNKILMNKTSTSSCSLIGLYQSNYNEIDSNKFINNIGILYSDGASSGNFIGNYCSGNSSAYYSDIIYLISSTINFIGNTFISNQYGILFNSSTKILFLNNLYVQNSNSIALSTGSIVRFINNTIANNTAGGIITSSSLSPTFYNNIIYGNTSYQVNVSSGNPEFYYCDIQGGNVSGATVNSNIINSSPSFTSGSDWSLSSSSSPCFNAGTIVPEFNQYTTDIIGNKRTLYGIPDIGAYEKKIPTQNVCGTISSNTRWNADTINITCNSTISNGVTVTIAPGVIVKLSPKVYLSGKVIALGDSLNNIVFTVSDTSGYWKKSYGGTYRYISALDSSSFKYCTFQYADTGIFGNNIKGLTLSNCKFQYNKVCAISLYNSNTTISKSTFYKNGLIYGTSLNYNGLYFYNSSSNISNSIIINNSGFTCDYCSNTYYSNCLFSNNDNISFESTDAVVTNSTFNNNTNFGFYLSNPVFYNDIFSTLNNQNFSFGIGTGSISNCLFYPGTTISGSNNVKQNPQFYKNTAGVGSSYNASLADFRLLSISSAVNTGLYPLPNITLPNTDLAGQPRQDGIIDIGAYENQSSIAKFVKQPVGGSICAGNSFSFSVLLSDTAAYQWQKDGQNITGATSPDFTINSSSNTNSGVYSCMVTNGYGTEFSNNVSLQVNTPPVIISQPQNQFVTNTSSLSVTIPVSGTNPFTYNWSNNSVPIINNNNTLTIASFTKQNEGIYNFTVNNSCGNLSSSAFGLYLLPKVKINGADTLPFLCEGDSMVFRVLNNFPATYQWYKNGIAISGDTLSVFSVSKVLSTDAGNYSCTLKSNYGNFNTTSILIVVNSVPKFILQPQNQLISEGTSFTSQVSASGTSPLLYQWYKNDQPILYETSNQLKEVGFTATNQGIYYSVVKNGCGIDTSNKVAFYIYPSIKILTKDSIPVVCIGDSFKLAINVSYAANYQWQKNGQNISRANSSTLLIHSCNISDQGSYSCIVSNSYGYNIIGTVTLQVNTPPAIVTQPKNQWIDQNSSFDETFVVNGNNPIEYQWYRNGKISITDTLNHLHFTSFNYNNEGLYYCAISNSCGIASTQNIRLYVSPVITNSSGSNICAGSSFKLSIFTNDTVIYQWQKNGNIINGATDSTYSISSVGANDQGNYSCIVLNSNGYKSAVPIFLQVYSVPIINDDIAGSLVEYGTSKTLTISADGNKPLKFNWFKDGSSIVDSTFKLVVDSFNLSDEGKYICKVSNNCGTIVSDTAMLALAPRICMVSVTDTTDKSKYGHNLIMWNKESRVVYKKYNIYRESTVAGFYDLIGTVPYNKPGFFEDTVVNPQDQAYLYKITAVDNNNNETDINLCAVHKTIHLITTYGVSGGIQLDWDQYIGFPYGTYYIYRGINRKQFSLVHQMASSTRSWTDFDTIVKPKDTLSYFVSVQKLNGCNPNNTKTKSGDGLLVESVSNMEDNRLRSSDSTVSIISNNIMYPKVKVYPNPFNLKTTINYSLQKRVQVNINLYDSYGNLLYNIMNKAQHEGNYSIIIDPIELNLKLGFYILETYFNNKLTVNKIVYIK
jgi:hypothetical protein